MKVPFAVLVAPHKAAVYPDYLPATSKLRFQRPIYDILGREPDVVYPLERLISSNARRPTYSKTGALWTPYGAYVAYRALVDKLRNAGLNRKVVDESSIVWGAAEGGVPVFERTAEMIYENGLAGPGQIRHYKNTIAQLPRVMLFCDAFGMTYFDAFLAESCSELVCVFSPRLDAGLLERFGPDIVVSQYSEETLAQPLGDSTVHQIIKSGIDNGRYSAGMLEQFVLTSSSLKVVLNETEATELTLEAQKALV